MKSFAALLLALSLAACARPAVPGVAMRFVVTGDAGATHSRLPADIDPARIYANGFSNGGGMAFVLSCTMSDRIAAVGLVGAAQTLPWSWCKERRAIPMIAFHGTADRFAFFNGGQSWVAPHPFPAVPIWTANWARRNRCGAKPVESLVARDVTRREYTQCAANASVVLYTIQG